MKETAWSEMWSRSPCPDCNEMNWVCHGSCDDITGIDPTSVVCHKCGERFCFAGGLDDLIEDDYPEDGVEDPRGSED